MASLQLHLQVKVCLYEAQGRYALCGIPWMRKVGIHCNGLQQRYLQGVPCGA